MKMTVGIYATDNRRKRKLLRLNQINLVISENCCVGNRLINPSALLGIILISFSLLCFRAICLLFLQIHNNPVEGAFS